MEAMAVMVVGGRVDGLSVSTAKQSKQGHLEQLRSGGGAMLGVA